MAAHLLTGKPQRFVLHAIDLLAAAREEAKALALQAAAASRRKSAAASAAEDEGEAESVAAVDACWGRRPSVPAAAAAMVAGSGRSLLVQSRLLLPGSAPAAAGAGALASARAAKGVLVARPASLAALHALARETFDWNDDEDEDEHTSGETGSASVKALAPILVLLQEGVQASSASPSGQASWGGAIDTEEAFQLLRDGDVLEVVRYPFPLPATKPATAAAGRTSLAKATGATHATGKRKRNGTVTGSGSSVSSTDVARTAAAVSPHVASPAAAAAAVVSPTTSASAPPVPAAGAPSTVSIEDAAAAASAAAAMLLDSSPAMPPLEDAMGQLVQVNPSPQSGDGGMMMHSGPNGVIQPIPVVPSSTSSASYTVSAGPTPAEEMALQQQLLQQHMLQHQQQMMMQQQAHAQQQALLAAHAKELNKQQYLVQAQAQVQAHQMHAQQMQAQMEAQRVQAILQAQMQQQQQEAQQAAIAQQQAAALAAAVMAARTIAPRTPPSQQQSPRQAQQQSVPAITIAANPIIATSPISVATPASSSTTGAGTGTAAAQGSSSSPSKSAGGPGDAAPAAAPAAVGYLNFRRFTSSGTTCPSAEPVSIKMKGAHKPMAKFMAAYAQYKQEPLSSLTFLRPAAGGDHAALYSEARLKSDASLYTLPLRPTDTLASLGWDDFTPKYVMVRSDKDDTATATTTGSGK